MNKRNLEIQMSRLYCSNLYAIVCDLYGNHVKDCRKKSVLNDFILTHDGEYILITNENVGVMKCKSIFSKFQFN